jgi:hypothetical protein
MHKNSARRAGASTRGSAYDVQRMGVSAEGEKGKKKKRKQLRRGINAWMHWVGRQGRYGLL